MGIDLLATPRLSPQAVRRIAAPPQAQRAWGVDLVSGGVYGGTRFTFLAALGTVILIVLEDFGVPIPEEVVVPLVAYIVAQGIADLGKERVKAEQGGS